METLTSCLKLAVKCILVSLDWRKREGRDLCQKWWIAESFDVNVRRSLDDVKYSITYSDR